jgi:VWFA-related protein
MLKISGRNAFLAISIAILVSGSGAQSDDREFGWSLTISPSARKKAEIRELASSPRSTADEGEIRVDTQLVLSDVLVQDKNGVPVPGLRSSDFEISENGNIQSIDVFAYGDSAIPRSIILVIDHSLSQWNHIDRSVAAAKVLVDSLRPTDRMAIVSDDIVLISDFISDKATLKELLESLRLKCGAGQFGKSHQYSALFAALNERITRNGTRNIVIFQTDGDQHAMLRTRSRVGSVDFSLDDIIATAERKGTTIYSVFTGPRYADMQERGMVEKARNDLLSQIRAFPATVNQLDPTKPIKLSDDYLKARAKRVIFEELAVAATAERSGGIAQSLESPDQAAAVYERILADIGRRYLVGYYPPERSSKEPREREVRITLRNKGDYRIIGGRTYVAY